MFARTITVDWFGELKVHYVYQRSTAKVSILLLFVHGRPGSFVEATKIPPLLTPVSADYPSFHIVAPSLPGFPWSEGVLEKGFHAEHYAKLFNKLMIPLGYSEYVTQGGDWGYVLTLTTASKYGPTHVRSSHSHMPTFRENPITFAAHTGNFFKNGRGYSAEQSTKPQTLGVSLADSPVGRIYEKLVTWTYVYPWTDDEVSVRIYYELAQAGQVVSFPKTTVPVGLSYFPKDLVQFPRAKVMFESEHEVGGHFAAYEQPEALVSDLRKMFGKSGHAAGVVPGYTPDIDRIERRKSWDGPRTS
ncbi:alpha/beta-hydrolase [Lactarius deliciosus]|nr:alpha/beta-hydrolase [Lactarius deliciosus]